MFDKFSHILTNEIGKPTFFVKFFLKGLVSSVYYVSVAIFVNQCEDKKLSILMWSGLVLGRLSGLVFVADIVR